MGSTGEPDRKRRLSSSLSPAAAPAPAAKRPSAMPFSEDKKLDVTVLKYKNQRLSEQLEVQKFEYYILQNKLNQLKEKQTSHSGTLVLVKKSWEQLVGDLERISVRMRGSAKDSSSITFDGSSPVQLDLLNRLKESGATESSDRVASAQSGNILPVPCTRTDNVLQNILCACSDACATNNELCGSLLATLKSNEERHLELQSTSGHLLSELSEVTKTLDDLYLDHRKLLDSYQNSRDSYIRDVAEKKHLSEELATTVTELEECNHKLTTLKAQSDITRGAPIFFPAIGNREMNGSKVKVKQKELQNLEATHKELEDQGLKSLAEIERLLEERIEVLKKLATYQNLLTNCKTVSSSKAFSTLSDQHQQLLEEMDQCCTSLEKLQVEKDKFIWQEQEVSVKIDMSDISQRMCEHSESRIVELEETLQKLTEQKIVLQTKLEEILREPGRKAVISEFKSLVSSLPKEMESMQSELTRYKDDASQLHSVRAEVQSLSSVLSRTEIQIESLSSEAAENNSEIARLQAVAQEMRYTNGELKLFLEMYKRESTDSRDLMDSKDREYKERAVVRGLELSLDDHKLERRVKAANESEASAQQRLAAAQAEIADLRDKLEASGRDIECLSENLKSKDEEGEAYSLEIESIGQAYEDMQSQNQQLLQQITERDDHNMTLLIEGIRAKQALDALKFDVRNLESSLIHARTMTELHNHKTLRLDNQLRVWADRVEKLSEDNWRNSVTLENSQRNLIDVRGESKQLRQEMDGIQEKFASSRLEVSELLVELEKERFKKKRIEEDLEVMSKKATSLRTRMEGLTDLEKLRQEAREYRAILKCSICRDRQKEVVITKCYHLFCGPCIRKSLESRQRRCPSCSTTFSANDVKPIYI